jgi:hypothetical protein
MTTPAGPRLCLINCASPWFFSIPMGAFGLADYLEGRGVAVRLFNPALYRDDEAAERLTAFLGDFRPTHAAFAFHWQETAHGLLAAVAAVRAWNPEIPTLAGGFTAAYFAEDLLGTVDGLDCVVAGDPEEPVLGWLSGEPAAAIANLVRRDADGGVRRSACSWLITQPLLDTLSFARLDLLVDADRYLEKLAGRLGFPVFLGRGCVFDCDYCGGSRHAFRRHSGRHQPVVRSLAAVLADLRRLVGRVTTLYLCYENDPAQVVALFRAIAADPELRHRFVLNYGAWHLLDDDFLDAYRAAFRDDAGVPVFEFSPEVVSDAARQRIKRTTTYTLEGLIANLREVAAALPGRARIEVFFSRYHPDTDAASLLDEIRAIVLLKHRWFADGTTAAHVCYDHLSTDVGSRYWERFIARPDSFAAFLEQKERIDRGGGHPFPVDNLCLYVPPELAADFLIRFEALVLVLERLEQQAHELFHILCACLGAGWLDELFALLPGFLGEERLPPFWTQPPLEPILVDLEQRLEAGGARTTMPFLHDLFAFSRAKLGRAALPATTGPGALAGDGSWVLDCKRVSVHGHDYPDLRRFLGRLTESHGNPAYERTVFLLLGEETLAVPHGFYRATLKRFETPTALSDYLDSLPERAGVDRRAPGRRVERLVREGVLVRSAAG